MSSNYFLAFDADDTLWHNERLFIEIQARFKDLLAHYHDPEWIAARLYETETRNIQHFGYGIKAFALSMIETAVELTEGRISGTDIQTMIGWAKEMLTADVELLPHVREVIPLLAERYPLMVITKGDLLDQEAKMARSGIGQYFRQVEVVSHKTPAVYAQILKKHGVEPARFWMVGNALRSDILPVLELGGHAVYVPQENTWIHESATLPPVGHPGFYELANLGELPALLEKLHV
ncbi:MAG TPA: HAD hydrolase-like protein [Anaerolineales bacterium]|nr:HAD hydrolase-like protein [Anaerolineales bacterium]